MENTIEELEVIETKPIDEVVENSNTDTAESVVEGDTAVEQSCHRAA